MIKWQLLILAVFCLLPRSLGKLDEKKVIRAEIKEDPVNKVTNINLDEAASRHLFQQWQDQAASGLMAVVASSKIKRVSKKDADEHTKCAKNALTVSEHALCVSKLLQAPDVKKGIKTTDLKQLLAKLKPEKIHQPANPYVSTTTTTTTTTEAPFKFAPDFDTHVDLDHAMRRKKDGVKSSFLKKRFRGAPVISFDANQSPLRRLRKYRSRRHQLQSSPQIGPFTVASRKKRFSVRSGDEFELLPSQQQLTPLGMVAKSLMGRILEAKNKTARVRWQESVHMAEETAKKRKDMRKRAKQRDLEMEESMGFRGLDKEFDPEDLMDMLDEDADPKDIIRKIKMKSKDPAVKLMNLLREGMKLTNIVLGRNVSNFDDKNVKVMSPRFFSVTPEDNGENTDDDDPMDILSPSILSLHGRGKGMERDLSIPHLVKSFTSADQQMWLDLIFEAADVNSAIDKASKVLDQEEFQLIRKKRYEERMVNDQGEPLYFTKEKALQVGGPTFNRSNEIFEQVMKSYTEDQMRQFNETGYAILSKQQLELVYGRDSPHANPHMVNHYGNMSFDEVETQLIGEIHQLAVNESFQRRQKDIVLSPVIFGNFIFDSAAVSQPLILSPLLFTNVIGSPIIYGTAILGPWVFLPLIMSPKLLSPAILNPFVFVPIVMSPLTLHPIILCPGLFNPFVLSPLVMTPLILSPVIWSPLAFFALVLSPNALSPVIESKLYFSEIILSPSWLS